VTGSNLEAARSLHDAFMGGDLDALLALLDEDVEWGIGAYLTGRASYRGKDGVREWWEEVRSLSEAGGETLVPTFEREEELPDGRILRLGQVRIIREQGNLESEFGALYTFGEGKITALRVHMSHAEALRAAGLED